jgi:electron transfer flavoprotein beta subunit
LPSTLSIDLAKINSDNEIFIMEIVVCIKQVPSNSNVKVDEKTGVLIRSGIETKINPFDLFALEAALQIKSKLNARIKIISMGPMQAADSIKEAFSMGADEGFLLTDPNFAGADTLATAYTISQGIRKIGIPSLILCGKQTTDGDTAQVGPEIAEFLEIPHITNVLRIIDVSQEEITLDQDLPENIQMVSAPFPCLLTVEKDIFQPRLPSYRRKQETCKRNISQLNLASLEDKNQDHYGLNGSPTRVIKIFSPQNERNHEFWGGGPQKLSQQLFVLLSSKQFI